MSYELPAEPTVRVLPSGWILVRWSSEVWAQVPPGLLGDHIQDEFIFHPDANRERVNAWAARFAAERGAS